MHEFSIATSLVDTLLDFAQKDYPKKITEVYLKVGKLRAISLDQLVFSYKILVKGTVLSGTKLLVEEIPATVNCEKCGFKDDFRFTDDSYHFGIPSLSCPKCGASLKLEGGDDVLISKIRIQGRNPQNPKD